MLGLFGHFQENIPNYALLAKRLSDLTTERFACKIPWREDQQQAFDTLKQLLINATQDPIGIFDMNKPFVIMVDASQYAVGGILTQPDDKGHNRPVALTSH